VTNEEYTVFSRKLFTAFPSLWEWLQKSSPAPLETQEIWRKCLVHYSLAECVGVLERWSDGTLEPFAAYERDKIHLLVRSICEMDRDRKRKRESQLEMNRPYREKRTQTNGGDNIGIGSSFDCNMVAAVKEGAIEHKRMLDGEIDEAEFERRKEVILIKHGI
jgi:hypothetical protein